MRIDFFLDLFDTSMRPKLLQFLRGIEELWVMPMEGYTTDAV